MAVNHSLTFQAITVRFWGSVCSGIFIQVKRWQV